MNFTLKETHTGKCALCGSGTVIKGSKSQESIIYCGMMETNLPFEVKECSSFHEKNAQNKWDMQQIAWIIEQKKGKFIGFLSPLDAKKKGVALDD